MRPYQLIHRRKAIKGDMPIPFLTMDLTRKFHNFVGCQIGMLLLNK
jgi:hypothetical protein